MTPDQRRADWVECGGSNSGNHNGRFRPLGSTDAIEDMANQRSWFNVQRCMLKKSYQWSGRCDNEIARSQPKCNAP